MSSRRVWHSSCGPSLRSRLWRLRLKLARTSARGLIGLLALTTSIVAAVLLIKAADSTPPRAASAASIALWAVFVALSWTYAASDSVLIAVGLAAIAALCASSVLVVTGQRRQRRVVTGQRRQRR